MLARLRKSRGSDEGFTLIELLVVMIIIGILASIAVPVFLSQRQKARDSATKSDVTNLGKEIAAYYVDGTAAINSVAINAATGLVEVKDSGGAVIASSKVTKGTAMQATSFKQGASKDTTWCVAMTNPDGSSSKDWHYAADGGLASGACP